MFGGPFYSAGVARIINGVNYRYRHVAYAHWVSITNGGRDPGHYEIRRETKLVATVKTQAEVDKFFDNVANRTDKREETL